MNNTKETGGYDFAKGDDKLFIQGKCDETLIKLVKDCDWLDDYCKILPEIHRAAL